MDTAPVYFSNPFKGLGLAVVSVVVRKVDQGLMTREMLPRWRFPNADRNLHDIVVAVRQDEISYQILFRKKTFKWQNLFQFQRTPTPKNNLDCPYKLDEWVLHQTVSESL